MKKSEFKSIVQEAVREQLNEAKGDLRWPDVHAGLYALGYSKKEIEKYLTL